MTLLAVLGRLRGMKMRRSVKVGGVEIGGGAPVRVQTMLNFGIAETERALIKITELKSAGCELIRVAVPDKASLAPLKELCENSPLPVIADIHFDPEIALKAIDYADKLRINPSNIKDKKSLAKVVKKALEKNIPIRIGVNTASLLQKRRESLKDLVNSSLVELGNELRLFEGLGFYDTVISIKTSNPRELIEINREMARLWDYPIHLGLTEAGTGFSGAIKSAVAMGALISEGVGDTIRVSLTGDPLNEVRTAWEILRATGVRRRGVEVIACPECGRMSFDVDKIARLVEARTVDVEKSLKVSIMGCVVNGPGEALRADFGLTGTAKGVVLYKGGKPVKRNLKPDEAVKLLLKLILDAR
ncbi:MAG: flavodoxin-dependent (E)-4-hydroxy-3-methylbut-2-enyl-diphosphate synthase [Myxococcota bacterium]